ncbi:MAG: Flp pilus assembly protein TadB [Arenicella sp.]|jgi:Flp pilus assembly protein TadB
MIESQHTPNNISLAGFWFILSLVLLCIGFKAAISTNAYFIYFFVLSFLIFQVGRQRTKRYKMCNQRFKKSILIVSLTLIFVPLLNASV